MLDAKRIVQIINSLGYKTFTFDYTIYNSYINKMLLWYKNFDPVFHYETEWNGFKYIKEKKARLGMAKRGCEDWSSLVFNDNLQVNISDKEVNKYLLGFDEMKGVLGQNNFWTVAGNLYEITCALGTGAIEIVLENMLQYDNALVATKDTKIKLCSHDATEIIPLSWTNSMDIKECAFVDQYSSLENKNDTIVELRLHIIDKKTGNYNIINKKLKVLGGIVDENVLKNIMFLDNSSVVDTFDTKSDIPWFSIIKTPVINNTYIHSPMGASVYGNAIDILMNIDGAFDALSTEFRYGKKKIFYSTRLLNRDPKTDEIVIPEDENRSVFYYMNNDEAIDGNKYIQEWNPLLRIDEITKGLDILLNYYSIMIGLGNNYYKFSNGSVLKTATEVVSQDNTLFRNVKKAEIACEKFLLNIFKALIYTENLVHNTNMDVNANIAIEFDQSIIEDKTSDRERAMREVELGLMTKEEYREKYIVGNRRDTVDISKKEE